MDQHIDAFRIGPDRRNGIRRSCDVAGEMDITAADLFDAARQMFRRLHCPGKTHDIVARPGEGLGDISAKTLRRAGEQQRAPDGAGHRRQIQRRMLAMIATCASQPAVKVSVRAAGIPAE